MVLGVAGALGVAGCDDSGGTLPAFDAVEAVEAWADAAPDADGVGPQGDGLEATADLADTGEAVADAPVVDDTPAEAAPDVPLVDGCQPSCAGRACGDDGCGGNCGYCSWGAACRANLCVPYCVPACDGKACGPDGCGDTCGACADGQVCAADQTCVAADCKPDCTGKQCGPNGCGGACSTCPEGQACSAQYACQVDTDCHDVDGKGQCTGALLEICTADGFHKETCDAAAGKICGLSAALKKFACLLPAECQAQCDGKECGPDRCGSSCGTCGGGQGCSDDGQCGPACGDLTVDGACTGTVLSFCYLGILITQDCAGTGRSCALDPAGKGGKGWYDCL